MLSGMERLVEIIGPAPSEMTPEELIARIEEIHQGVTRSLAANQKVQRRVREVQGEQQEAKVKKVVARRQKLSVLSDDALIAEILKRKAAEKETT